MIKKILFWSPYIGKVGTKNAVINSAIALSKSKKYKCKIINVFGEFDNYDKFFIENNLEEIKLIKNRLIFLLPDKGFFFSRIKFFLIFIFSFFPLLFYLKKNKNDYLFIYLITSLPLLITTIFNLDNKIIFRVSGKIYFSIFRNFVYKISKKKIFKILVQTSYSKKIFLDKKIFKNKDVSIVYDPIIDQKKINKLKKEKIEKKYLKKKYFISIGRLSVQKNFIFLLRCIKKIIRFEKNYNFLILGNGEQKNYIKDFIKNNKLSNYVTLGGYKKNVYKYIKNSSGLICTSLWEEPGFIIQEAAACNKIILTSNCKSGPEEFLRYGKNGYIFKNNNKKSFIKIFKNLLNEKKKHDLKIKNNLQTIKLYSKYKFYKDINKIL